MNTLGSLVKKNSLLFFFILAYALTWALYPLMKVSVIYGIPGLFAPALAAVITAALVEGKAGVRALLGRLSIWRVGLQWWLVALGLPLLISALSVGLSVLFGGPAEIQLSPISALSAIVFVLVVGEEIGWRGFALPRLLDRFSPLVASIILGILWGLWHLPTFLLPDSPQADIPLAGFLVFTTALSVLFTWSFLHTQGSLLMATLFHGAVNTFGFTNSTVQTSQGYWYIAAAYTLAAVILVLLAGPRLARQRTPSREPARV